MKKVLVVVVSGMALLLGVTAPASAATTGAQTFNFIYIGDGDSAQVSATGPIQGTGSALTISDDGEGHGVDKVTFKKGTFLLDHADTSGSDSFNEHSCVARFTGRGDYTLSSGTGAYKGVSGSGTYSYKGTFFGHPTPDGCSEDGIVLITVRAWGTTTL